MIKSQTQTKAHEIFQEFSVVGLIPENCLLVCEVAVAVRNKAEASLYNTEAIHTA